MVISRNNDMPIFASHAGFSENHELHIEQKTRGLIHGMAYYNNAINIHQDLSPNRIQPDEEDVKAIIDVINKNFISPFEEQELMRLSNVVLSMEKVANDLVTGDEKRLAALNAFIEDRLVKQTTGFYKPIKKLKLSTCSTLKKSVKLQISTADSREKHFWEDSYHEPGEKH